MPDENPLPSSPAAAAGETVPLGGARGSRDDRTADPSAHGRFNSERAGFDLHPAKRREASPAKAVGTDEAEPARSKLYRLAPELKPYLPLLPAGIQLLLSTWDFPEIPRVAVKVTRVRTTAQIESDIAYLATHAKKPAAEIVAAALVRAQRSNLRPTPLKPKHRRAAS